MDARARTNAAAAAVADSSLEEGLRGRNRRRGSSSGAKGHAARWAFATALLCVVGGTVVWTIMLGMGPRTVNKHGFLLTGEMDVDGKPAVVIPPHPAPREPLSHQLVERVYGGLAAEAARPGPASPLPAKALRRAADGAGRPCAWLSTPAEAEALARLAAKSPELDCVELFGVYRAERRGTLLRELVGEAGSAYRHSTAGAGAVTAPQVVADWQTGSGEALGSGSVVRDPASGALLYSFDRWTSRAGTDVYVSRDEGLTWTRGLRALEMKWATLFVSGEDVYLLGVHEYFWYTVDKKNPVVLTRMERGSAGMQWSPVVEVSPDLRVHMANGAVTVSRGAVHVTFTHDLSASSAVPPAATAADLEVRLSDLDARKMLLPLASEAAAAAVPMYSLVSLTAKPAATRDAQVGGEDDVLFLRVLGREGAALRVRPERWDLAHDAKPPVSNRISFPLPVNRPAAGPWRFPAGSYVRPLMVTFGDMQWGMLRAQTGEDLLRPEAWSLVSTPVSNPAMAYPREFGELFGITPVLGRREGQPINCGLNIGRNECPYWQESVSVRHEHADPADLTVALRMTNDMACDMAMLVRVRSEEGAGGRYEGAFAQAGHIPGMSVVRSHFVWDEPSQLYWVVGNAAHHIMPGDNVPGQWPRCTWDRSTLMLHYSANLINWFEAAPVAVATERGRHYTYGFAMVDGRDLLVAAHSNPDKFPGPRPGNLLIASHNSPVATLHRLTDFRRLANPLLVYRTPVAH